MAKVTAAAAGGRLTVTAVAPGEASVTVIARDPGGLTATQRMNVVVRDPGPTTPPPPPNQSPETVGTIGAVELTVGSSVEVDVSGNFRDPEGGALAYSAAAADGGVATASASGSVVEVVGVGSGETT